MPHDLKYPIGKFTRPAKPLVQADRKQMIEAIGQTPAWMRAAVQGLTDAQLDTPYRPGGWTVRQVAHHMPDSHMNAYCRFKLALTEDTPTIKPYDEAKWAELPDAQSKLVEHSLTLLDSLHTRWVFMLTRMKAADFARKLAHPEWDAPLSLDAMLALYAWHGKHHAAHITRLRERSGW
ncbi:MAG: putative metal-dependent hydrolase [Gemmatimonadaceae bacterium]